MPCGIGCAVHYLLKPFIHEELPIVWTAWDRRPACSSCLNLVMMQWTQ